VASFISFLAQIGFTRQVQQHLRFAKPTSNNAIPLAVFAFDARISIPPSSNRMSFHSSR
jgi:hypothetical protein